MEDLRNFEPHPRASGYTGRSSTSWTLGYKLIQSGAENICLVHIIAQNVEDF